MSIFDGKRSLAYPTEPLDRHTADSLCHSRWLALNKDNVESIKFLGAIDKSRIPSGHTFEGPRRRTESFGMPLRCRNDAPSSLLGVVNADEILIDIVS